MKSRKKQPKKAKRVKRARAPKPQPPKVLVYDLRPTGQPGPQAGDLSQTIINFSAWRCDGTDAPEPNVNAGSVPFTLGDNVKAIQSKVIEAVAAMYGVEQADVVILP